MQVTFRSWLAPKTSMAVQLGVLQNVFFSFHAQSTGIHLILKNNVEYLPNKDIILSRSTWLQHADLFLVESNILLSTK